MGRARLVTEGIVLAALCGLLLPAAASAASGTSLKALNSLEFRLELSKGRSLSVHSSSGGVTVTVDERQGKGGEGKSEVSSAYLVPVPFSKHSIDASFGKLGSVAMDFKPSRPHRIRSRQKDCSTQVFKGIGGVFTGNFRFRLEDGSVKVERRRVRGQLAIPFGDPTCGGGADRTIASSAQPTAKAAEEAVVLNASDCSGTSLYVTTPPVGAKAGDSSSVVVLHGETRGRMRILRLAFAYAPGSWLTYSEDLLSASLSVPRPFAGTADFSRNAATGRGELSGSLAVAFPGKQVGLVPPAMSASLGKSDEGFVGLLETTLSQGSLCRGSKKGE